MARVYVAEVQRDMVRWVILAAGSGIFAAMIWVSRFHFRPFVLNARMMWIAIPSVAAFAVFLLKTPPVAPDPMVAGVIGALFAVSAAILSAAVIATRLEPPRLAFEGAPRNLVVGGPYRFVRHPFYLAYILFWCGCALATQHVLSVLLLALLAAVYVIAASGEERDFAVSAMAAGYDLYRRRTGFLWPAVRRAGLTTPSQPRRH